MLGNRPVQQPTIYNQYRLINRINLYFGKLNRPLWHLGFCHGLVLLWLQKMAEGKEQEFYNTIKKIIDYPLNKIEELDNEQDVQIFLAQIRYAHHSMKYSYGPEIKQIDVDLILETPKQLYRKDFFSVKKFTK